jgi:hypothetical protein
MKYKRLSKKIFPAKNLKTLICPLNYLGVNWFFLKKLK